MAAHELASSSPGKVFIILSDQEFKTECCSPMFDSADVFALPAPVEYSQNQAS
jgi:hypothetical protein